MEVLGKYTNGNYQVTIYNDGTKIRENDLDNLTPAFAENCDVKLTDKCSQGCKFCYEGCTWNGEHSDIMNQPWIHTLHPYTELAINGNDLDHPQLEEFLVFLKKKNVIANITVNQNQFFSNLLKLHAWLEAGLVYGLGVSLVDPNEAFITEAKKFPNLVIHTINGILTKAQIEKLANNNLKILILGYKNLRRGVDFLTDNAKMVKDNQTYLKENLKDIIKKFKVVSFDNLAIEQLSIKDIVEPEKWEEFYMGDDGCYTYFIDAVKKEFARNSLSLERFPIMDNVDDMFNFIRNK